MQRCARAIAMATVFAGLCYGACGPRHISVKGTDAGSAGAGSSTPTPSGGTVSDGAASGGAANGGAANGGAANGGAAGGATNGDAANGIRGGQNDGGSAAKDSGPSLYFGFDDDAEGFVLDTSQTLPPFSENNLQNLGAVSGSAQRPMVAFDGTFGEPALGALRISATFTDFYQSVTAEGSFAQNDVIDLHGRTLWAQVKRINEGRDFTGQVRLVALAKAADGHYAMAAGDAVELLDYKWHTLIFQPDVAQTGGQFDARRVLQLGLRIESGSPPTEDAGAAGAAGYGAPQSTSLYLDTVTSD
jgi:hypothetical protein